MTERLAQRIRVEIPGQMARMVSSASSLYKLKYAGPSRTYHPPFQFLTSGPLSYVLGVYSLYGLGKK